MPQFNKEELPSSGLPEDAHSTSTDEYNKAGKALFKLRKLIEAKNNEEAINYRDQFAVVCHLSMLGYEAPALKLLTSLFDVLGWLGNKNYFIGLRRNLKNNAKEWGRTIQPHCEVKDLFR